MEPQIRYAHAPDGTSIAFWMIGEGSALLMLPPLGYSHIELEWRDARIRAWYERLATSRRVIRLDPRGFGLSDRHATDFSLEAMVGDIQLVCDKAGVPTYSLYATGLWMPIALSAASRHADRVNRLVVWHSEPDVPRSRRQLLAELRLRDWELYAEVAAHELIGWPRGSVAHALARFMRASTDQEAIIGFYDARSRDRVAPLLNGVSAPTLVLYRPGSDSFDELRGLAADVPVAESALLRLRDLPNATLVPLDADVVAPYLSEQTTILIESFLGDGPSRSSDPATAHSGTAIILFADIADSTALNEQWGDDRFRDRQRVLDATLRAIIAEENGTSVAGRTLGDGVLAEFASARSAIQAAVRCIKAGDDCSLRLHLGVHAGDVIREERNVWGGAVNIAARICSLSKPGEVLVSDVVRALARTSGGVVFEDRGKVELKGIDEPQHLFAVLPLELG